MRAQCAPLRWRQLAKRPRHRQAVQPATTGRVAQLRFGPLQKVVAQEGLGLFCQGTERRGRLVLVSRNGLVRRHEDARALKRCSKDSTPTVSPNLYRHRDREAVQARATPSSLRDLRRQTPARQEAQPARLAEGQHAAIGARVDLGLPRHLARPVAGPEPPTNPPHGLCITLYADADKARYTRSVARPKKPQSQRRSALLPVRLTQAERRIIAAAARREGVSASAWVRLLAVAASK